MLIVFFGTFIVLAKVSFSESAKLILGKGLRKSSEPRSGSTLFTPKINVLEGLVPIASVSGGDSAIDVSYKSFSDSSRGFNSIPGDNVQSQPSKSQNEMEADARAAYQQKQQQEQAIADEQRKKQRDQYLPPQTAQAQAPSRVSLIPQSSQSMPMISLTPQQQVSTTPTTSSTQVEIYNRF